MWALIQSLNVGNVAGRNISIWLFRSPAYLRCAVYFITSTNSKQMKVQKGQSFKKKIESEFLGNKRVYILCHNRFMKFCAAVY